MTFTDGHRFSRKMNISEKSISEFALKAGDLNPIHHDKEYAEKSRYGNLIASGPQTSALLMSYTATYFSEFSPMLGLEFNFRFKAPVIADDEVKLEWMIVHSRKSKKFGGQLIDLRGRMISSNGQTVVGAKGKVLLSENLM